MDPMAVTILAALGTLSVIGALALALRRSRGTDRLSSVDPDGSATTTGQKDWIVAFVWAREHATPEELRALGEALDAWMPLHPLVTRILGLESLLAGKYPLPDGPTPYVEDPDGEPMPVPCRKEGEIGVEIRRMSVVDPWVYCPALVYALEGMESTRAIESLKRAIPPGLVSDIGYSFF